MADAEVSIIESEDHHNDGKYFFGGATIIICVAGCFCLAAFLPKLFLRSFYTMDEVLCSSKGCLAVSRLINSSVSGELDPCDDFYAYVCDGWRRSHSLRQPVSQRNVFGEVDDMVRSQLHESLLKLAAKHSQNNTGISVGKMATIYLACTKSLTPEGNGVVSMRRFLGRLGLTWPDQDGSHMNATDLLELLVGLSMTWNVDVLFAYTVKSLSKGKGAVTLALPGPFMPGQQSDSQKGLYEKLIVSMAFLFGRKNDYKEFARKLVAIDDAILAFRNRNQVSVTYLVQDLGNLCAEFTWQDWMLALNRNLPAATALTAEKSVIVHHPSYIGRLLSYLLNHELQDDVKAYLALRVLLKYGQATYDIRHIQEIVLRAGKDIPEIEVMKTCQQWMEKLMLETWNTFVSETLVTLSDIERLSQLVANVKRVFVGRIRKIPWMDNQTKNKSVLKASNIAFNIPILTSGPALDKAYATLPDFKGDFLDMVCRLVEAFKNDNKFALSRVIDRSDSVTVHSKANSMYVYSLNVVNVNAALMVVPFYTDGLPVAITYGSVGTIIAHEIIHGFDVSGRLYDDAGGFADWWSNSTNAAYRESVTCLLDQMQELSHLSGSVTLEENVADNGGLRCAYDAYTVAASQVPKLVQLRGLENFEEDQLFFVSYCYKFCGVDPGGHVSERARQPSHPIERLRCNVPLMNLAEFSSAFECEPGSSMNPSEKCSVW